GSRGVDARNRVHAELGYRARGRQRGAVDDLVVGEHAPVVQRTDGGRAERRGCPLDGDRGRGGRERGAARAARVGGGLRDADRVAHVGAGGYGRLGACAADRVAAAARGFALAPL